MGLFFVNVTTNRILPYIYVLGFSVFQHGIRLFKRVGLSQRVSVTKKSFGFLFTAECVTGRKRKSQEGVRMTDFA